MDSKVTIVRLTEKESRLLHAIERLSAYWENERKGMSHNSPEKDNAKQFIGQLDELRCDLLADYGE